MSVLLPFPIIHCDPEVLYRWDNRNRILMLRGSGIFRADTVDGELHVSDAVTATLKQVTGQVVLMGNADFAAEQVNGKMQILDQGSGEVKATLALDVSGQGNIIAKAIAADINFADMAYGVVGICMGGVKLRDGSTFTGKHIEGDALVEGLAEIRCESIQGNLTIKGEAISKVQKVSGETFDNREASQVKI